MPEQQEPGFNPSPTDSFNAFYFALTCYAWAFLPVTRSGIGKRAGGLHALIATVGMLWWASRNQCEEMFAYFWVWLGFVVYRRLTPDKDVISEYQGWPYLTAWLFKDEITARLLEAVLVWTLGNYLIPVSAPLGKFVAFGGICLVLKYGVEWLYMSRMDDAMRDAEILMKYRMERAKRR